MHGPNEHGPGEEVEDGLKKIEEAGSEEEKLRIERELIEQTDNRPKDQDPEGGADADA